ncbi:hypothetical protein BD779DRAFT_1667170 [Infundibulicybe gibba]|nr:hypothetical protein BD779DRAFT_1667170 [Infundibulicybe gibba]
MASQSWFRARAKFGRHGTKGLFVPAPTLPLSSSSITFKPQFQIFASRLLCSHQAPHPHSLYKSHSFYPHRYRQDCLSDLYTHSFSHQSTSYIARHGRSAPRLHRLPQRLDYTLIPAPLDLSLPLATEKSPLPAIIVTPSSPCSTHDFSIAFLAPPPKPSIRDRISAFKPFQSTVQLRTRTMFIIFLVIFVFVCHVVTHNLAIRRPHLEFAVQGGDPHLVDPPSFGNWFGFRSSWDSNAPNEKGDYVIDNSTI